MDKPIKGGYFHLREMYYSPAYLSLNAPALKILNFLLDKRQTESKKGASKRSHGKRLPQFINAENISLPYSELEKKYGIKRQTTARAFDELLEKGFIEIRHHGGMCQHDKTAYAVPPAVDKWQQWKPGMKPFASRQRDVRRGYQGKKTGVIAQSSRTNCDPSTRAKCDP